MSEIIFPPKLKPGQKVAVVAPAGMVQTGHLDVAINLLEEWGLSVVLGNHVYGSYAYFSGTDADRLSDLQQAMEDPEIDCILFARGGYGTTRILDQIDFRLFLEQPKWIVGFSDITALHLKLNKLRIASIHGPMGTSFKRKGAQNSLEALNSALFGTAQPIFAKGCGFNINGDAAGELIGGNLALLVDSLGTPTELHTNSKILFIEDIGEPVYKIDRMMTHLRRSGKLSKLSGLVVGDFSEVNKQAQNSVRLWHEVIRDEVRSFNYPVAFGLPVGHEPENLPLVCGGRYRLTVSDRKSTLEYLGASIL